MSMGIRFLVMGFVLFVVVALTSFQLEAASPFMTWSKVLAEPVVSVDWSPDGESIVFGNPDSRQITLLNWQTSEIIWQTPLLETDLTHRPYSYSIRWSRDGNWIAVTNNRQVYLINAQTGDYHALSISVPVKRDQPAYTLPRWGVDSNSLAVLDTNGFIDILDSTTGEIIETISLTGGTRYADLNITAFDWSPDGQFFVAPYLNATMTAQTVGFWDRTGKLVERYTQESVSDPVPQTPCPRNAGSPVADNISFLEWANDSRTLVVGLTYGLAVCRLHIDGTIDVRELQSYGTGFHWSPDQRWLAGAINTDTGVWIADTANDYQTVWEQPPDGSAVTSFSWSPDSKRLAVGTIRELWIGTLDSSTN